MITTALEILAACLIAAGLAILTASLIDGGIGIGIGLLVASVPLIALSFAASRRTA